MAGNSSTSATPVSPAPNGVHKNRLTECFDDIMKVAAEMMVQQQLKTVQLDSSVVNGFSQAQQKVLSEKVHMFHAILDDLQTTLAKSKSYVGTIHEIAVGKQKAKEKERADLKKRQEEEEQQRKNKEEEEKARREEIEKKADEQRQPQSKPDTAAGFPLDTSGGLMSEFVGSPDMPMGMGQPQTASGATPGQQRQVPGSQPSPQSELRQSQPSDLGGMGSMDISMFPGLESSGFDMGTFNSGPTGGSRSENITAEASGPNAEPNANDDSNGFSMGDNGEDYLTLNDFNDMNIDWGSGGGDPGDLDLNGFNI